MNTISVAAARALDVDAVQRLGMPSILLMENAGRAVADVARELGTEHVVVCGPGNNGGDGLVAARHLGPATRIALLAEPDPRRCPDAALQLRILRAAGWRLTVGRLPDVGSGSVWIDALYGTGLTRPVEGVAAAWIERMNAVRGAKLAVDVPSGLHADDGVPTGPACVRADVTVTFAAAKHGLVASGAAPFVGRIVVASLGIPAAPH